MEFWGFVVAGLELGLFSVTLVVSDGVLIIHPKGADFGNLSVVLQFIKRMTRRDCLCSRTGGGPVRSRGAKKRIV